MVLRNRFNLLIALILTTGCGGDSDSSSECDDQSADATAKEDCENGVDGQNPGSQPGGNSTWDDPDFATTTLSGTVNGEEWSVVRAVYQQDPFDSSGEDIISFSFIAFEPDWSTSYCSVSDGFDAEDSRKLFGVSVPNAVGETNFYEKSINGDNTTATISYTPANTTTPSNYITNKVKINLETIENHVATGSIVFEYDEDHTLNGSFSAYKCDAFHKNGRPDRQCVDSDTGICYEYSAENYDDLPDCMDLGLSSRYTENCGQADINPVKGCHRVEDGVTRVAWYPTANYTADEAEADCEDKAIDPIFQ